MVLMATATERPLTGQTETETETGGSRMLMVLYLSAERSLPFPSRVKLVKEVGWHDRDDFRRSVDVGRIKRSVRAGRLGKPCRNRKTRTETLVRAVLQQGVEGRGQGKGQLQAISLATRL